MKLLHYLEVVNFKLFGETQRIELDHPSVLIGPNNCGKTSVIQALALWSQAVKTWHDARKDSTAKERPATALNRLAIVAVPVQRTRYFWHNTRVHTGRENIPMSIAAGLWWKGKTQTLRMNFRHQGDELVYCQPDNLQPETLELVEYAASLTVDLLYPMSGLATEEPVLKPGRVNVLLGQGDTAQVLRNLCLTVVKDQPEGWESIRSLAKRLFAVDLGIPEENARGSIDLLYREAEIKEEMDISMAGRGFQQLLLVLAYLHSHRGSILLIDEPDAHLELLRQRQIYVLLRDIAERNDCQVILVTHSEVVLDEALDHNLTLILEGRADNLAQRTAIRGTLKHYGAEHYVKARERGYVLYVEGSTDVDMLRALADRTEHPLAARWDEKLNAYYVQDNYPEPSLDRELERVEGGFGVTPRVHFRALRELVPGLRGLAILDNDGRDRRNMEEGELRIVYWRRYEAENYFITPDLLTRYATDRLADQELFGGFRDRIAEAMKGLIREQVFAGIEADYRTYATANPEAARLIWETKTERLKLSDFAEEFFRRLAAATSIPMLLRKGTLHQLAPFVDPASIHAEVREKLDLLSALLTPPPGRDERTS